MLTQILEDKWEIYHVFFFSSSNFENKLKKNSQGSHKRRNLCKSIKSICICIDSGNFSWFVVKDIQHIHV